MGCTVVLTPALTLRLKPTSSPLREDIFVLTCSGIAIREWRILTSLDCSLSGEWPQSVILREERQFTGGPRASFPSKNQIGISSNPRDKIVEMKIEICCTGFDFIVHK